MRAEPHGRPLCPGIADLALDVKTYEDLPEIFNAKAALWTPLRRAGVPPGLVGAPEEFVFLKKHLRDITGAISSIRNKAYVAYLATLIDGPWRSHKSHTQKQARRAWQNGCPDP